MSDLIDREHVIDFLKLTRDSEYEKSMSAEVKHKSVIRSKHDAHVAFCDYLIEYVKQVPTHQTHSNTLGALDCISRQAAIDAVDKRFDDIPVEQTQEILLLRRDLRTLPSAEPERKKGKWIYNSPVTMKCNQCGLVIKDWDWHRFKYCPNCCAKMEVKYD